MKVVRIRNFKECIVCQNKSHPHDVGAEIQLVLTIHVCRQDIEKIDWSAVFELPGEMNLMEFIKMLSGPDTNLEAIKNIIKNAITYDGDTDLPKMVKDIGDGEVTSLPTSDIRYPPPNRPHFTYRIGAVE